MTERNDSKPRRARGRRVGPVFSGGMWVIVGTIVAVLLFAAGSLVGVLLDRDDTVTSGTLPPGSPGVTSAEETATAGANATKSPTPASDSTSTGEPSDATQVTKKPSVVDGSPPHGAVSFLDVSFGASILPAGAGGLSRKGSVSASADTVSAVYQGDATSGVDLLRVTVKKTSDNAAARAAATGMITDFPIGPVTFEYGARQVSQFITDEGRPDAFPPAISLTWTQGRYAIQVAVIPAAPDTVEAARESALAYIADLEF